MTCSLDRHRSFGSEKFRLRRDTRQKRAQTKRPITNPSVRSDRKRRNRDVQPRALAQPIP